MGHKHGVVDQLSLCSHGVGLEGAGVGLGTLRSQNSRDSGLRRWCLHSDPRTVVYVCNLEQVPQPSRGLFSSSMKWVSNNPRVKCLESFPRTVPA